MRIARLLLAFGLVTASAVACDSQFGDTPTATFVPPPQGKDKTIAQIADPESQDRVKPGSSVSVSGAVIVAVDTYNETPGGNAAGTIYVSDLSGAPYSGAALFNPTWVPGNLRPGAGDAFDFQGTYTESGTLPIVFAPDTFLVQLSNPVGTFRYEASVPEPTVIDIEDLETFEKGRQWMNMLVTVKNVTVYRDLTTASKSGRLSAGLLPAPTGDAGVASNGSVCAPFPQAPTLVNELMDLVPLQIKEGTKLKSLTGIVSFFCNLHIAPRTAADVVIAK